MLPDYINNSFIFISVMFGVVGMILTWLYAIEAWKGVSIADLNTFDVYINLMCFISTATLALMWITTVGQERILFARYLFLLIGWTLNSVLILIINLFVKKEVKNKGQIYKLGGLGILRAFLMFVIFAFIC